jgi:dTDP-4-dehydrorhamnose reductase
MPLFVKWRDALRAGGTITPFVDMWMAPVPLATAVAVTRLVADSRAGGTWQVSGDHDINYVHAAELLARMLDADPSQVRPVGAQSAGRISSHLPKNTTLCVDRLRHEFGLQPPSTDWTIRDALSQITSSERRG